MPVQKTKRAYTRSSPEQIYERLVDVHRGTLRRMQRLEAKHGFRKPEKSEAVPVPAIQVSPMMALDHTGAAGLMKATFVVPSAVAWKMAGAFSDYLTEVTKPA